MSVTITDEKLITELAQTSATVEIRGPDGRFLGMFTPSKAPPINISEEELRRREADRTSKTYTAAEVEAKLRELRCTQ